MSFDTGRGPEPLEAPVSRRRFLAAAAAAGGGAAAGCSTVSKQEFEAQPVVLHKDGREELILAKSGQDSSTVTREVDAVDGEVTITSHTASYVRGPARGTPTLIEKFLRRVNGTDGAGGAVAILGSELDKHGGLMDLQGFTWVNNGSITAEQISLVLPSGVRSDSETDSEGTNPRSPMLLGWMTDDVNFMEFNTYVVRPQEFFPGPLVGTSQSPDAGYNHISRWTPTIHSPDPDRFVKDGRVLVVTGEAGPEAVFGLTAEEMPGERVEAGETVGPGDIPSLFAVSGGTGMHPDDYSFTPRDFDNAEPLPTRLATFGQGVLSTPAAKVAGLSVNPLANMGFEEILTSDQFSRGGFVADAIPSDTETTEWLAGPTPLADVPWPSADVPWPSADWNPSPSDAAIFDQETDWGSFLGVVSGEDGPWGVGVHMARVVHDGDFVIATGAHSWPVGSAEYLDIDRGERFTGIVGSILTEAQGLTAGAGKRFVAGREGM